MKLPYATELFPGREAVEICHQLRRESRSTYTPVILGPSSILERTLQDFTYRPTSVRVILEQAEDIDVHAFFGERWAAKKAYLNDGDVGWGNKRPPHVQRLRTHFDFLKQDFYGQVVICKVPTPRCWEVPAYFKAGDCNDSPPAEVHTAIHKYWYDLYEAEIISFSGWWQMEFTVGNPPCDEASAMELAKQYYGYCPDSVLQGSMTLEALARSLIKSDVWFFWWD